MFRPKNWDPKCRESKWTCSCQSHIQMSAYENGLVVSSSPLSYYLPRWTRTRGKLQSAVQRILERIAKQLPPSHTEQIMGIARYRAWTLVRSSRSMAHAVSSMKIVVGYVHPSFVSAIVSSISCSSPHCMMRRKFKQPRLASRSFF